jgi:hypothetical protein
MKAVRGGHPKIIPIVFSCRFEDHPSASGGNLSQLFLHPLYASTDRLASSSIVIVGRALIRRVLS